MAMNDIAHELHIIFNALPRYSYPFNEHLSKIPPNGIYIKFQKGEEYKSMYRIVRIGTDSGENQLHSRLSQHFENENQRRSIFRKNIGRCILNRDRDEYLRSWDLNFTSRSDKVKNLKYVDLNYESKIERQVSAYIQSNFSFCFFGVETKDERLFWERKIIATTAQADNIIPSPNWLGNFSPKSKIKSSGLWQVQGLNGPKMTRTEFDLLLKRV